MTSHVARAISTVAAALTLFVATAEVVGSQSPIAASVAITNVTVIDTASGALRPDITILVKGDRITEVAPAARVSVSANAQQVDGRGKFLIPGLWDMHVHVFGNGDQDDTEGSEYFFPLLVANGVVGVRDMGTDADDIARVNRWNAEIEAGRLTAPRVIVTSRIVDGEPPTWSNSLVVRSAEEGRAAVRTLKASGAQTIKVYWNLSRDAYLAIADESTKEELPFAGHVPYVMTASEASTIGQRSIEHLDGVAQACSSKESEWLSKRQARMWTAADALEMRRTFDESKCDALAATFKRNNTWLVPTTVVFFDPKNLDSSSRLRFARPPVAERMRQGAPKPGARADEITRNAELAMRRTMGRAAAALFLVGSDLSEARPTNLPGFSLHDELQLLVEAGLTPLEALQTATLNPARFFRRESELGTVAVGKLADLVLLDANPLNAITSTTKVNAVVSNGRLFRRADLDDLLAKAAAAANR